MGKRDSAILELLSKEGKIEVSSLADALGVSSVTMRKDLDGLEAKGIVKREHGFAHLGNRDDIAGRLAIHYDDKLKIARRAIDLVSDGETVMIESGSCCALMARELFEKKKDIVVITNSAFIAHFVRDIPQSNVILMGGNYQSDSQAVVGPLVAECARDFQVKRYFIGTDGFTVASGFTNDDQYRAQVVRDMAKQAETVVVLTESEKFGRKGVVSLKLDKKIDVVVTDNKLSRQDLQDVRSYAREVIQVSV